VSLTVGNGWRADHPFCSSGVGNAPIAAVRGTAIEMAGSTQTGFSGRGAHRQRQCQRLTVRLSCREASAHCWQIAETEVSEDLGDAGPEELSRLCEARSHARQRGTPFFASRVSPSLLTACGARVDVGSSTTEEAP
jgi:hypothetical protein